MLVNIFLNILLIFCFIIYIGDCYDICLSFGVYYVSLFWFRDFCNVFNLVWNCLFLSGNCLVSLIGK